MRIVIFFHNSFLRWFHHCCEFQERPLQKSHFSDCLCCGCMEQFRLTGHNWMWCNVTYLWVAKRHEPDREGFHHRAALEIVWTHSSTNATKWTNILIIPHSLKISSRWMTDLSASINIGLFLWRDKSKTSISSKGIFHLMISGMCTEFWKMFSSASLFHH